MSLFYQINVSGTTYAGSTAFNSPETTYTPLENFALPAALYIEPTIGASNVETTDINDFDLGLFVGNSGAAGAGILGFATNSFLHLYNGGNSSQAAGIDVVGQSFDSASGFWRFIIGDESTARGVQLNYYNSSSSFLSAPKPIILGEIALRFSPDLRSVEGFVSLESGGFIEPTTTAYAASFQGSLGQVYQGIVESDSYEVSLLENIGFDAVSYLESNRDLLNAFGYNLDAARQHYLQFGIEEGRLVNFDAVSYLASYDDLINAFGYNPDAARQHYQQSGILEGRSISFEADDYLASHGDLIQAFGYNLAAAAQHYISLGAAEGRSRDSFDEVGYLNNYSDLRAVFGNNYAAATQHYISFGYGEGRTD